MSDGPEARFLDSLEREQAIDFAHGDFEHETCFESVLLHDMTAMLPQVLRVVRVEGETTIVQIDLYADAQCQVCLAEDIRPERLPKSTLQALYGALAEHDHARAQERHDFSWLLKSIVEPPL